MQINTKYFDSIEYEKKDILYLDEGLFGFEDLREYILIHFDPEDDSLLCLQSTQDESLAFVLMNPFSVSRDYSPTLSQEDIDKLGLTEDSSIAYYSICVIRDKIADSTINLKCPLVINTETRHARQAMLENSEYTFRHYLGDFSKLDKEGRHADPATKEK